MENAAYVSRVTGKVQWASTMIEVEDELPDDIEDGTLYIAVPHKTDLDLGKNLALDFARDCLPQSIDTIAGFFRQRGAYGRFKDLLERKGARQAWYEYEAQAVERALREWSSENDLPLKA